MMEQRQHVRKSLATSALVADPLGKNWKPIALLDISIAGAAFSTSERIIVDTVRTFKFVLPNNPKEIETVAKVVNRAPAADGFRVGVSFTKIDHEAVTAIRHYIEGEGGS